MNRRRASLSAVVATLVTNMLDSSSSSSSSDSEEELILHELINSAHKSKKRKLADYIEKALFECSDEEFFQDFRIRRTTVVALIERYARSSSYVPHFDHGGYPQKSPEEHILSFLWYATNKVCIKDVAIRFNISDSTVHGITERLLDYLCSLLPKEIRFPQDLDVVVGGFQQLAGFPGVVGCIGGTCINTRAPAHVKAASGRLDVASVALQAVCDHSGRFLDVFVGPPGDLEAESVFLASPLAEELPHWCQGRHHLLGGPGYPLREYLLTPYDTPPLPLSPREAAFNERHERARAKIDEAFALLKGRFRQLHFLEFVTANKMRRFIMACCVLHNLCVRAGDVQLGQPEQPDSSGQGLAVGGGQSEEAEEEDERELGSVKRDQLALGFVQGC